MKLRLGKKNKSDSPEEFEVAKSKETGDGTVKEKRKKKKVEYEGSRWAALIMLIIVIIVSLVFFVVGQGGVGNPLEGMEVNWSEWGWSRTYEYR